MLICTMCGCMGGYPLLLFHCFLGDKRFGKEKISVYFPTGLSVKSLGKCLGRTFSFLENGLHELASEKMYTKF